ncbi:RluA family pseudouridine synthase [Candidatus Phytoplasma asteris]|uniref:Pseudouridine synthase n=3 Tax=16SrI (Aster yellows group) TaxID=3042590 RepID=Q2NIN6_AYWBP|nr:MULTISPECIES: RluA family pseudouridine synthase [16SrI (Aster yellows group)]ABC65707.1 ribosomal large subunit pseudouridine synthase D [Aster yellows witches'-broom phytoplasma AYWB]PEH36141.1 pseudouridine synthase [New Jersey aster yellows phytoplasma]
MNEKKEFLISASEAFQRLDHFLSAHINLNKSQCQKLILAQQVLVNTKSSKKSYLLKPQDLITVIIPQTHESINLQTPQNLNLDIIYEDPYLAVINKPANLVVHPSLSFQKTTLVNGLLHQFNTLSHIDTQRPGIVHRLDKNTTGLLIVAKTNDVSDKLQIAFQQRKITKIYWALIEGFLEDKGIIKLPIGRNNHNRLKMQVMPDGKTAVTHFKTLQRFSHFSLMECNLETGRTHQLRAHFSFLKHPIVGDLLYDSSHHITPLGQFLHSKILKFNHPITNQNLILEAPLPTNFEKLLKTFTDSNCIF